MKNNKTKKEVIFNSFNFILFKETIVDEEVPDLKYQKLYVESIRFAEKYGISINLGVAGLKFEQGYNKDSYHAENMYITLKTCDLNDTAFINILREASNFLKSVKAFTSSAEW